MNKIIFISLLGLVLMTACSKDEKDNGDGNKGLIVGHTWQIYESAIDGQTILQQPPTLILMEFRNDGKLYVTEDNNLLETFSYEFLDNFNIKLEKPGLTQEVVYHIELVTTENLNFTQASPNAYVAVYHCRRTI